MKPKINLFPKMTGNLEVPISSFPKVYFKSGPRVHFDIA